MRTWEHIYADNSAKLKGVCRRYVASDEVAEDIMHDAFEIAMKKVDSYSGKGSFYGWLYQITVNTALQYLRKNKTTVNKTDDLLDYHINKGKETGSPQNKKSHVHQANFEVSDLLEAIDLLPEHHRTVFNLYVLEKYSHQEISNELNITVNTSKSHLNRARKKLQEILFEKAKNKEKGNLKKYLLLFFPFYFSIDRLYANEFKNYRFAGNINRIQLSKIGVANSGSVFKLSHAISLAIISAIIIGFFVFLEKAEKQEYKAIGIANVINHKPLNIGLYIEELDSLFTALKKEELELLNSKVKAAKKKQVLIQVPVVIHKQVIVKDTIEK